MQLKVAQIVQELLVEHAGGPEVINILLDEFQVIHRIHELLQARHNGVAAAIRHPAEEHIKDRIFVLIALVQIAGRHSQLIEIGHGGQISCNIQHFWLNSPFGTGRRPAVFAVPHQGSTDTCIYADSPAGGRAAATR